MGIWDQLVDCIVRPPRDIYTTEDLIGGTRGRFRVDYWNAVREDCTLLNKKGLKLECSHFIPSAVRGVDGNKLPCVIYAHCNRCQQPPCRP